MITVYHGARPAVPLAACCRHLGCKEPGGPAWNWRGRPLWVAGKDAGGNTVCCLVHGRHRGLYRRALTGIASLFGMTVTWVDTDAVLWRESVNGFIWFVTLMVFAYFPGMLRERSHRAIDRWIQLRVLNQQEEQR